MVRRLDEGMADDSECILLLDNGSLRAEATLQLRSLAKGLSHMLGTAVQPVSLLHSSKVDPAQLFGKNAKTLVPFMREQRQLGVNRFKVIPLFFGPSGALVDYLPARVSDLIAEGWAELDVRVVPTLVGDGDFRIAEIMAKLIREKMAECGWQMPAVAMCDHGSPSKEVNAARELVVKQLGGILRDECVLVKSCSMERREGQQYDFNEPLLESLLGSEGFKQRVIVSMLFVGPGRHAGDDGDVAQICNQAKNQSSQLDVEMTALVGSARESLIEILADRFHQS